MNSILIFAAIYGSLVSGEFKHAPYTVRIKTPAPKTEEWRKAHVFKPGTVELTFRGFPYRFGYAAKLTPTEKGYFLEPENGRIELDLTK